MDLSWPLVVISRSPKETLRLGQELGAALARNGEAEPGGVLIALIGELGAGKTMFTKGLAAGLGVRDPSNVTSPTFVLRQDYSGRIAIHHYDAYRLSGSGELLSLGFEEDLASGAAVVVEWADRVSEAIPPEALTVELEHAPPADVTGPAAGDLGRRRITFQGSQMRWWTRISGAAAAAGLAAPPER